MAHISRYPLVRHLRSTPTTHIVTMRRGKYRSRGTGVSFWFRPLTAVISEVPVDDRELPMAFRARTKDFQDAMVQGTVTYRVTDPAVAAQRVDFSIDTKSGVWRATPLQQLASLLTETAQQHALNLLVRTSLADALSTGVTTVRDAVEAGLRSDERLAATGLDVIGVRIVAIRPEEEVERALQTPTREQIQQDADKATYERRALAVESERTISENELQSQIELAKREELLVAQRGANARKSAEEAAAANKIEAAAQASRQTTLAKASAESKRVIGEAEAAAETAKLGAYSGVSEGMVLALAARGAADNLPQIGNLVLTPDLLAPVLAKLGGADAKPAPAPRSRAKAPKSSAATMSAPRVSAPAPADSEPGIIPDDHH